MEYDASLVTWQWKPACNAGDAGNVGSIPGLGRSLGEVMVTHSSILAWRIPWTEAPGGLQSKWSQRVGHAWMTKHNHTVMLHKVSTVSIISKDLEHKWNMDSVHNLKMEVFEYFHCS